jgi:hypothetical protein
MMKLTLNQNEVEQAISDYVAGLGLDLSNMTPVVNIIAGRGANGTYAEVDLEPKTKPLVVTKPAEDVKAAPMSKVAVVPVAAEVELVEPDMSRDEDEQEEEAPLTEATVNLFEKEGDAEASAADEAEEDEAPFAATGTESLFGSR